MTPDYHFLAIYVEGEIHRLGKVLSRLNEDRAENERLAAFFEAGIAAGSPSSARHQRGLNDIDKKLAEAAEKRSHVEPKLEKLKEQLPILLELGQ